HPDYREVVLERIRQSQEEKRTTVPIEEKFIRMDGKLIDVEAAALPIRYGGVQATKVLIRDITERKQAEKALRESEERYRTLFLAAYDGIFLMEANRFVDCNP
ncbi:PAS domain S-box protein, partial [Candidatus Saccharibacteria bacterium]|nr:PAS domain S-box protein [candidate division KSB1 bacterium]NIV69690.1 PAS domain S-box protein [Phycisphaerae bacterium]NIV98133.1 PAS domain S-box protein [Candidatus Saccharibacteria bacterium]